MWNSGNSSEPKVYALALRGPDGEGEKKNKPWCDHCKKPWHTKDTCWKIHGKRHI